MANEKLAQIQNHTENLEKVLYETNFSTTAENGKTYPKTRVKAEYYTYEWERLNKEEKYEKYSWEKIVISVAKLTLNNWNTEIAKKILKNRNGEPYIVDDKKEIILSVEEFEHLMTNIDLEIESKKKLTKTEKKSKDEEVSIEDIPF